MPYNHITAYLSEKDAIALKAIAKSKGFIVTRGPCVGQGSISLLLQALAQGHLTAIKLKP